MAKILIAEDEPDIRALVKFALEYAGHEIVQAEDGAQAVEMAREILPELIIMDVRMPKMTGHEACVEMKRDENLKDTPVVFLSAKGQDIEVQQGMNAGATEYILKPFAPDVLIARVSEILAEHAATEEQ